MLQTGEGHSHSWGWFPSALGCSVAYLPLPPLRNIDGQELGSLGPICSHALQIPSPGPGSPRAGAGALAQAAEPGLGELQELPPLSLGLESATESARKGRSAGGVARAMLHPFLGPRAGDSGCSGEGELG